MPLIRITDLDDPRIADYRHLAEPIWLEKRGLFVAEGRLVVRRLLATKRFEVQSVLLTPAAWAAGVGSASEEHPTPLYQVPVQFMRGLTGFNFHRGCLALAKRPPTVGPTEVLAGLAGPAVVVVLEEVANADNVGSVFRNAAAFGAAAVLLSPGCCDPLYRKAIRTSMAATLHVPFARLEPWPAALASVRDAGFDLIALTPATDAKPLATFRQEPSGPRRVALLVGTEGAGLSEDALGRASVRLRVAMAPGVDSLNLATATGIALHHLRTTGADV